MTTEDLIPDHLAPALASLQQGDLTAAEKLCRAACQNYPSDHWPQMLLGHVLHRLNQDDEALIWLNKASEISANLPQVWNDLADIALHRNDAVAAERAARQAIRLAPNNPVALFSLAHALFLQQQDAEAEHLFEQAIQYDPRASDVRLQLGLLCYQRGNFAAAGKHFQALIRIQPSRVDLWVNLALAQLRQGIFDLARQAMRRAVGLAPNDAEIATRYALLLEEVKADIDEIISAKRRAVELAPQSRDAHLRLAFSLVAAQRHREVRAVCDRVLQISPEDLTARWLRFQLPEQVVFPDSAAMRRFHEEWENGLAYFEEIADDDPRLSAQAQEMLSTATNFYLAYLGEPLVDLQRRYAQLIRRMVRIACPGSVETARRHIGAKRRRIGVVSSFLHEHSVSKVWSGAFLSLAREDFELVAFYLDEREDASTQRWRERADRVESGKRSLREWISVIEASAVDVLVLLDIGMDHYQQALAALRLAPVQATTWAHPVTSGMRAIDYFLSADGAEPEDAASHYSEQLVRLPRLGTLLLPPAAASQSVVATGATTRFACLQNAAKLHPGHDELFARIVRDCPGSRLDLFTGAATHIAADLENRLRAAFQAQNLDFGERCAVHPRLDDAEYRSRLAGADVILDSLDFSGGITTLDALWQNKPVVTLPGKLMRGRQSYAMLKLMDLDELIAQDKDDYVRIAGRLSRDRAWRQSIGERIQARKHALFEDAGVAKALAGFLREVESPAAMAHGPCI